MLKLHKDKRNTFECKIKIEGAKLENANTRLVLSGVQMDYSFKGKVDSMGNCFVELPPLKILENSEGTATLEVFVDGGFFQPFETEYKLVTREVTVTEVKVTDDSYQVKVSAEVKEPIKRKIVHETKKKKPVVKKHDSHMFKENCTKNDIKVVKAVLEGFKGLDKENRDILKEHIEFKYRPTKKVLKWARGVFKDTKSSVPKMVMYKVEQTI